MFVLIKDNYDILKLELNESTTYKGIRIYKSNNHYYVDLVLGWSFADNTKSKQLEKMSYVIKQPKVLYDIYLYVYEDSVGINDYGVYKKDNFIICFDQRASIINKDEHASKYYLAYKNNQLFSNFDISYNRHKYDEEKIKEGDVVEFLGIKIYFYDNFIYINKFKNINNLLEYKYEDALIKYKDEVLEDNYYIPEEIKPLVIEELKEYKSERKPNNIDFVKSLLPNIIMCLAMSIMAYVNYISNSSNNDVNILSYIIMPLSMFVTSIIIPIIFIIVSNMSFNKNAKQIKKDYLQYLDGYKNRLIQNINEYIRTSNSRFFNLIESKKKMFYANRKSHEFLKLSIGKIVINSELNFVKCEDNDINNSLIEIEKLGNYIDDYPLFLDINENRIITIVSKKSDKRQRFNSVLLELAYKHHYEDISIGVYSKDNNLFNNIYNLPHLFINNQRLTLNSDEQLQNIDQSKLDKPLVMLLYDKCDFKFNNANIHVIYFSCDLANVYKDSSAIVQYFENKGCLFRGGKQNFSYFDEEIDFDEYFSYIGRFKRVGNDNNTKSFIDVFGKDIDRLYKDKNHSLKAEFACVKDETISFDLHESKQGPHGLIGGSTGSGKSELIVSLLLSLCIRYSPEYLNIVLIDYKGGGIQDSLSCDGITIPHIVASVSNLENNSLQRLIIALKNECTYRLSLFKKLSNKLNLSIMNLDDYLDNKGEFEPMSHLLIVVDEFAELKKQQPEQIKELISISRIGRSLGIHLILATQKPAGVIDDEIWSNSRFKIALKVFDEKDSQDIIKSKNAAYLTLPGSFYLTVDGSTIKGQSIYAKNDVNKKDPFKVSLLNNTLGVYKVYKHQQRFSQSIASYYCKKIIDWCSNNNFVIKKIEYKPPVQPYRTDISITGALVFGIVDDYINNTKKALIYMINETLLIYSSRKHEINSILNTLNENNRKTIVIGNNVYRGKCISDSITYENSEDIKYLFLTLLNTKNNNLTLVIEDINCLLSYDEAYSELLCKLVKRKDNIDISLIAISKSSQLSFKLINLFDKKLLINILDNSDLISFYGTRSQYVGNSYCFIDMPISMVPIKEEKYIEGKSIYQNIIKRIPENIKPEVFNGKYLIGYDINTKEKVFVDNVTIVSFDEEALEIYSNSYHELSSQIYTHKFKVNDNKDILWLGSGVFNQRIFVTGLNDDLSADEGIYIHGNKKIIIRRLNNV